MSDDDMPDADSMYNKMKVSEFTEFLNGVCYNS